MLQLALPVLLVLLSSCESSHRDAGASSPIRDETLLQDHATPTPPTKVSDARANERAKTDSRDLEERAEIEPEGYQLGVPTKVWVAAMRWKKLWRRDLHEGVRLLPTWDGRFVVMAPEEATSDDATKLAEALGVESSRRPYPTAHRIVPALHQTTSYLDIRSEPRLGSRLMIHIPRGTVVVGLRGEIEGWASEPERRGGWTYLVATTEDHGWSRSRALRDDSGCLPSPVPMLEGIRGFHRDSYRRRILYVRTTLLDGGKQRSGFMIFGLGLGMGGYSYLGVFPKKGRGCALDEGPVLRITFPRDVFVVGSEHEGGESLVVVSQGGFHKRESVTWEAYRLGETEPFWKRVLLTRPEWPRGKKKDRVRGGATRTIDGEKRYYPLHITLADGQEEFLRYESGRFVADQ